MATALANGMHTAGIYSDMTVDGPEIGTLVAIVDRAKNLPNVKRMGKQNPYCAARLGKEAKKTETDKRGGQTPKWDQELRFTVHDSADYYNLKVSIFNDDKKTDLIGEAWINLDNVCVPGGGRHDGWHALNFKGKYAGEIMLELTYYDSRPQPENARKVSGVSSAEGLRKHIKRRPLPADLGGAVPSPSSLVPDHARGPRQMAGRPVEDWSPQGLRPRTLPHAHTAPAAPAVQHPYPDDHDYPHDYHPGFHPTPMPDLPQISPTRRHRGSVPPQPTMPHPYPGHEQYHSRSQSNPHLPHTHSAPNVAAAYAHSGGFDESLPRCLQPTVEDVDEADAESDRPPLPPSHLPVRTASGDDYIPPCNYAATPPGFRSSYSGYPPPAPSAAASSPIYARQSRVASRHSVADPYAMTPPRAHPLAHEMRRSASPLPYADDQQSYYNNEPSPSPRPPRNNLDAIRHPVQTFSTQGSSPTRKEVSRPSTSSGNFFSPDSFDSLNPNASHNSPFASTSNPHSPYHIPNAPDEHDEGARPLPDINAPIVGFDGRVIDPSDHLPVHSWAPEPEKKTPSKIYGSGAEHHPHGLSGPRVAHGTPTRVSRDVVVNVRTRGTPTKRPMSSASHHSGMTGSPGPLSEIDVPNPYAGGARFSANFADGRPGVYDGRHSHYQNPSPGASPHYGDLFGKYPSGGDPYGYENNAAPYDQHGYGASALSKEMAKIDIGGSRRPLSRGTVRRGAWP